MGEPRKRLNPQVESQVNRILLKQSVKLLLYIVFLLPIETINKRGIKPYDYRKIIALCILRILLKKTYIDYEIEMRTDPRICKPFGMKILPGKSSIQRGMELLNFNLLQQINFLLLKDVVNKKLNILIDSSGIRIIARSIWFCIRIGKKISKKECDKVHIAVCAESRLILNWRITNGKKHDCPYFIILLKPFHWLGNVMADKGYLSRANFQFVADRRGQAFIPFKKGKKKSSTDSPKSYPAWKFAYHYWKTLRGLYMSIYHERSVIESVFSAIKKKYGDKLNCKNAKMRRREMSLRLIAYNIRILLYIEHAKLNNMDLWVRVEKK
jgi:hypothetical protein